MPEPLTLRQQECYDCLLAYIEKHGVSPTMEDLGLAMGTDENAAYYYASALVKKGWARREKHRARSLLPVAVATRGELLAITERAARLDQADAGCSREACYQLAADARAALGMNGQDQEVSDAEE